MAGSSRAHLITGGFPPGAAAGHDHDFARLKILEILAEEQVPASAANDYNDVDRWLPISKLLITYVAGPVMNDAQNAFVREWIEQGGKWVGLHGSSGGKAVRVGEDGRRRAMVRMNHHDTLGGFFLNHPPVRKFTVDVANGEHPLTRGIAEPFDVIDEPYMIEVVHPEDSKILLTSQLGPDNSPPGFGFVYEKDTALMADGKTRAIAFQRDIGLGAVAYCSLGHCHSPSTNSQPFVDASVSADGKTPMTLRVTWESPSFQRFLRNAIAWGMGG